jgi:hypothetical protein
MSETLPSIPELDAGPQGSALEAVTAAQLGDTTGGDTPAPPGAGAGAPKRKRKLSGAQRRKMERQRAEAETLRPSDLRPAPASAVVEGPPPPADEPAEGDDGARAAAREAKRAQLRDDPAAAEQLREQIAALLQLAFTGMGYAFGDFAGNVWPLSKAQEDDLSTLFLKAHGVELAEHLDGGIVVKVLAWSSLAKVAGDKFVTYRRLTAAGDPSRVVAVAAPPAVTSTGVEGPGRRRGPGR